MAHTAHAAHKPCPQSRPSSRPSRLLDWVESQACVTRVWLDELIAEGDPQELVSLIHRQAAWLDLMKQRLQHQTGEN